jgi:hypothetical protein
VTGVYKILVVKRDGNRPLETSRNKWRNNIKMDLQEPGCGVRTGLSWLDTIQNEMGGLSKGKELALATCVLQLNHPPPPRFAKRRNHAVYIFTLNYSMLKDMTSLPIALQCTWCYCVTKIMILWSPG